MKRLMSDNARIFCALVQRDMKVFRSKFKDAFIDGMVVVLLQVIISGYLLPQMGMKSSLIAPMYINTMMLMIFDIGFSQSLRTMFDIKFNRYIDYLITLPLPKRWLFSTYIVSSMLENFCTTLPVITVGVVLLKAYFPIANIQWVPLFAFYILSLLFTSIFFLMLAFAFSYDWFMNNIWPRLLSPLLCISATFVTWNGINQFSPYMAQVTLLNPFTYIAEGLRQGLLKSDIYLPYAWCIPAVSVALIIVSILFNYCIKRNLDPV